MLFALRDWIGMWLTWFFPWSRCVEIPWECFWLGVVMGGLYDLYSRARIRREQARLVGRRANADEVRLTNYPDCRQLSIPGCNPLSSHSSESEDGIEEGKQV